MNDKAQSNEEPQSGDKTQFAIFGYGSLVNLTTLARPPLVWHRARLYGWQRRWLPRPRVAGSFAPIDDLAFLSVEPKEASAIDGVLLVYDFAEKPVLDAREVLYERISLCEDDLAFPDGEPPLDSIEMAVYTAEDRGPPSDGPRILRSYLDAVGQGFLTHFGADGLSHFSQTTASFHLDIFEDRAEPLYPRAVALSDQERLLIDEWKPPMARRSRGSGAT